MYSVIRDNINNGACESKVDYSNLSSLKRGTIIDDKESVDWNRTTVAKINEKRFADRLAYRKSL